MQLVHDVYYHNTLFHNYKWNRNNRHHHNKHEQVHLAMFGNSVRSIVHSKVRAEQQLQFWRENDAVGNRHKHSILSVANR